MVPATKPKDARHDPSLTRKTPFSARRSSPRAEAEACSRRSRWCDRSIARRETLRGTHRRCPTSRLCLDLASRNPSWQRSCATASTDRTYDRKRSDPQLQSSCKQGAVHIWVPAPRLRGDRLRGNDPSETALFIRVELLPFPDPGDFDRLRPQSDVRRDHGGEFFRAVAERIDAEIGKTLDNFRVLDGAGDLFRNPLNDVFGRACGRQQSVPSERLESGKPRLAQGRNIRNLRGALFARYREQPKGTARLVRHRVG